jgi:hypothetical protein
MGMDVNIDGERALAECALAGVEFTIDEAGNLRAFYASTWIAVMWLDAEWARPRRDRFVPATNFSNDCPLDKSVVEAAMRALSPCTLNDGHD